MGNIHQTNVGSRMIRIKDCTNNLLPWYRSHKGKVFAVREVRYGDGAAIPANATMPKVWWVTTGAFWGKLLMRVDCEAIQGNT